MKGDSDSEEEILVYAEFEDSVNIDKYRSIHILGAAEKKPIIQLDETFFIGKYENALGTYMFFENDPSIQGKDPLFDKYPEKSVKYVCKTRKLLSMEYAYVTPKEGKETHSQSLAKETEDVKPVKFRDLQQATDAFRAYFISDPTSTSDQNPDISTEPIKKQDFYNERIETKTKLNTEDVNIEFANEQNTSEIVIEYINEQSTENHEMQSAIEHRADIVTESSNKQNTETIVKELSTN